MLTVCKTRSEESILINLFTLTRIISTENSTITSRELVIGSNFNENCFFYLKAHNNEK